MEINLNDQKRAGLNPNQPTSKFKELLNNKKVLYSLIIGVLALGVGGAAFAVSKSTNDNTNNGTETADNSDTPKDSNTAIPTPTPVTFESPINGFVMNQSQYDELREKPALAVMIQNNAASRPEYGLNKADVVYETIAEDVITRFMGVYWSEGSEQVRSIRSARKYFVDLLGDYNNPVYMHEGYASGALNVSAIDAIHNYEIRSLGFGSGALQRDLDCQQYRAIEHCAYSTTELMWELANQSGWAGDASKLQPWKFKDVGAVSKSAGGELKDFTVNFSGVDLIEYSVNWKYDEATKKYLRFNLDGTPYTTDGDTEQVMKDIVIFQKIPSFYSGDEQGHMIQEVIGEGDGYVMQDGKVYNIKWSKPDFNTRTKFTDATTSEEFIFNRGKIWINLVSSEYDFVNNTPVAEPTIGEVVQ